MNYIGHGSIQVEKIGEITIGDFPMMVLVSKPFQFRFFKLRYTKPFSEPWKAFESLPIVGFSPFPMRCSRSDYDVVDGWGMQQTMVAWMVGVKKRLGTSSIFYPIKLEISSCPQVIPWVRQGRYETHLSWRRERRTPAWDPQICQPCGPTQGLSDANQWRAVVIGPLWNTRCRLSSSNQQQGKAIWQHAPRVGK